MQRDQPGDQEDKIAITNPDRQHLESLIAAYWRGARDEQALRTLVSAAYELGNAGLSEFRAEVESNLPLNGRNECFWCACGPKPDDHFWHATDDGVVKCLHHPAYERARRLLGIK